MITDYPDSFITSPAERFPFVLDFIPLSVLKGKTSMNTKHIQQNHIPPATRKVSGLNICALVVFGPGRHGKHCSTSSLILHQQCVCQASRPADEQPPDSSHTLDNEL